MAEEEVDQNVLKKYDIQQRLGKGVSTLHAALAAPGYRRKAFRTSVCRCAAVTAVSFVHSTLSRPSFRGRRTASSGRQWTGRIARSSRSRRFSMRSRMRLTRRCVEGCAGRDACPLHTRAGVLVEACSRVRPMRCWKRRGNCTVRGLMPYLLRRLPPLTMPLAANLP
eukprot:249054-Chlamydomonas_euryale.AAC.7